MDRNDSTEYNAKVEVEQNVANISGAARNAERKLRLKIDLVFAIKGILTIGIALVAFITLIDCPEIARWLSEEKKQRIFLLNNITVSGSSFFLPTIICTIPGRTTVRQQIPTLPPYIVGAFFILVILTLSWRYNHGQIFISISGPSIIVGYSIFLATLNANIRYVAVFLCASAAFTLGAMCNA
ncbi:hypothetical protein BU25DRAFT_462777 [Macroventuria anomochaeta]|uniref:Uncharacterized protein n=1 Tax=Macroventuria anomochaeta TaxID=301207 RepID=A0ACB6RKZ7_9PLEO|nr:uncharacterized protein BU25DRAFT_462777 [Macroventuria anomochaeta]KAF2622444.1 hypothetical protein BU25DRAFT_462777 [Macroventuria anomochaeta]